MELILPDIVAIGIYNSNMVTKNKTITKSRKTTMFEIEIPLEEGGISYINSDSMPISPNIIICAKPGQVRHTKLPFKCYYIHIILKSGMLYNALMNLPNYIQINKYEKYYDLYRRMHKHYDSYLENDEIILHGLILELIYSIIKDSKKNGIKEYAKNNNAHIIEKAIMFIKENFTSNISLEIVANHVGLSPIYFHNCFKASTGLTLREYVENYRIKKAINMLCETNITLASIAYECGFSSQSYFSYAFKRKTGLTPREYAKKIVDQYEHE